MIFLPIIIFGLGLIIGSFLNVVILRLNTGRSIANGRSKCTRCSNTLSWYELIPVFSFIGLRGKCRTCKNPISFQYPVVELVTALTFIVLYTKILLPQGFNFVSILSFIGTLTIASLLIVIMVYDFKHKIIPDKIVIPFIVISFFSIIWKALTINNFVVLPYILAGFAVAAPFFLIWLISKGKAMGFGDVKLALGMGWLLGMSLGFSMFFLSFWIGSVVGLLLIALSHAKLKSQIPFAPFLIIALFIVSVWNISLQTLFPIWQ